jgi:outer membrane protein assembly factor BamB
MMVGVMGGLVGALVIVVWWVLFSRAPWTERLGAIVLMIVALFATSRLIHQSIANGMMGMMLPIFAIPVLCLALVAWAVASRRLSSRPRRASMVVSLLLACGVFVLLRTGGITGDADSDFHWRWTKTPEERLLAQTGDEPAAPPPAPAATNNAADWPGFRGPERNGVVHGVRIKTDWTASPPVELWRRPIGPGWSSFAVRGDLFYTQEQRGEDEIVACYNVSTGEPVWRHRDAARFWESNAGAGPRGTPTLSNGSVYTFGATGILNALDAGNGAIVWSRDAASDTHKKIPGWGFASSPLVVGDVVVIATAGILAAYDVATGNPRWLGPAGGGGYSSPHLMMIAGVAQVLLLNGAGAISVAPADGTVLWQHPWPGDGIVQPAVTADGDVLIGSGSGLGGAKVGVRRITARLGPGGWTVEERWTSIGLKPYFNDFVVHKGHAFGFDGSHLACIDLEDGKRKWKDGRYGNGQLVLLPDQDVLVVLSEEGELALVGATPDQFNELARFPAIKGKTWNHPVLVGDVLLVRNSEEMAAFRLSRPASAG